MTGSVRPESRTEQSPVPTMIPVCAIYVGNGFDRSVFSNPRPFPFIHAGVRNRMSEQPGSIVVNRRATARFYSLFSVGKRRHSVRRRCKTSRALPHQGTCLNTVRARMYDNRRPILRERGN